MAGATVTISGIEKTKTRIKRIVPEIEKQLRETLIVEAKALVAEAQAAIDAPKSGRTYRGKTRSGQFYRWQASAPGEAPAKRTGENRDKIKAKRWNRKEKPGARILYPNIFRMLDRGIGGSRPVKARPLFSKLMQGRAEKVRGSVESATSRVLNTKIRRK
jgi:hypothetical protein